MSATATSCASGSCSTCLSRSCPRPPTPIMPRRTRSLAPNTREGEYARSAAAPMAACFINPRSEDIESRLGQTLSPAGNGHHMAGRRLQNIACGWVPSSPVPHGPIELAVYRQVSAFIMELCRQLLVKVHAKPRLVPGMQITVLEPIRVRKNFIGLPGVPHVFLDSK